MSNAIYYSAIHKAAGLTVPSHSMILPGTIPETPVSREWSQWLEMVQPLANSFVNSAVSLHQPSYRRVMFLVVSVCHSIWRGRG